MDHLQDPHQNLYLNSSLIPAEKANVKPTNAITLHLTYHVHIGAYKKDKKNSSDSNEREQAEHVHVEEDSNNEDKLTVQINLQKKISICWRTGENYLFHLNGMMELRIFKLLSNFLLS